MDAPTFPTFPTFATFPTSPTFLTFRGTEADGNEGCRGKPGQLPSGYLGDKGGESYGEEEARDDYLQRTRELGQWDECRGGGSARQWISNMDK